MALSPVFVSPAPLMVAWMAPAPVPVNPGCPTRVSGQVPEPRSGRVLAGGFNTQPALCALILYSLNPASSAAAKLSLTHRGSFEQLLANQPGHTDSQRRRLVTPSSRSRDAASMTGNGPLSWPVYLDLSRNWVSASVVNVKGALPQR
jgi:hypothetical protein